MYTFSIVKPLIIFILFIYCFSSQGQNDVYWSDLVSENGSAISSNDIIVVEPDDRLIISTSCNDDIFLNAKGILVYGDLLVENTNSNQNCLRSSLTLDWIMVTQGADLTIGEASARYDGNFEIIISSKENEVFSLDAVINEDANYLSTSISSQSNTDVRMPSPSQLETMVGTENYSFIMAMGANAEISLHSTSASTKKSWVQLDQTLSAGSNSIVLEENPRWEVGDRIVIATTDFDLNQSEEFTITNVSANGRRITLDKDASFMHYGDIETYSNGTRTWDLDMRAEVGLLSRNLKIRGDTDFDPEVLLNQQANTFGGHIMVMMDAKAYIQGVELENMGQGGNLGRYPFHWHMLVDGDGQYVKDCSIHHTFNKGLTIHGTQNTLVQDNVIFETIGHSYFLEDGSEVGNQIIGNLSVNTRKPRSEAEESPDSEDFEHASSFWIENSDNTITNNHAAGSERHGFFFSLRGLNGQSNRAPFRDIFMPIENSEGPTEFSGNVSHSNVGRSFFLNHAGIVRNESYRGTDQQPQLVDENWTINNFTGYKSNLSIYARAIGGVFDEIKLAEIGAGTRFRLNQMLQNALVVGRTGNTGHPLTTAEISEGRSLPTTEHFTGHQLYDGPGGLSNVHFHGFNGSNDAAIRQSNAVHKATTHYAYQVTFEDTPDANKIEYNSNTLIESRALVDIDGSITGIVGAKIVAESREPIYHSQNSYVVSDWNASVLLGEVTVGSLRFRGDFHNAAPAGDEPIVNGNAIPNENNLISSLVSISNTSGAIVENINLNNLQGDQSLFVENSGFDYKVSLINAPPSFQLYVSDLPLDKDVIYEIEGLDPILARFYKDDSLNTPLPEVGSMADLESEPNTAIYRNENTGNIHIKITAELRHGWLFPQPKMTYQNRLIGGNMINVVLCKNSMSLAESELTINGFYEASEEIVVEGDMDVLSSRNITLAAPEVIFNGDVKVSQGGVLRIKPNGCQ